MFGFVMLLSSILLYMCAPAPGSVEYFMVHLYPTSGSVRFMVIVSRWRIAAKFFKITPSLSDRLFYQRRKARYPFIIAILCKSHRLQIQATNIHSLGPICLINVFPCTPSMKAIRPRPEESVSGRIVFWARHGWILNMNVGSTREESRRIEIVPFDP